MKKVGILNTQINYIIANAKHGNKIMVTDAGFPIPYGKFVADVAITKDFPKIIDILAPLFSEFIYEEIVVAEEQMKNNPNHYNRLNTLVKRCSITTVSHEKILKEISKNVDFFIRTGDYEPWGNVVITSGIDAPRWFEKQNVIVPDDYKERVGYKE